MQQRAKQTRISDHGSYVIWALVPLTLVSFFVSSCSSSPTQPERDVKTQNTSSKRGGRQAVGQPGVSGALEGSSTLENAEYREIQGLFSKGKYDEALRRISEFEQSHPESPLDPQIRNLHGLIYILTKKPGSAIPQLKRAVDNSSSNNFKQFALYNLATAYFENSQFDDAQHSLSDLQPGVLDRETQVKFHSLRARVYLKQNEFENSAKETLLAAKLVDERQAKDLFSPQLEQALAQIQKRGPLESLYKDNENSPLADRVLFRLGMIEIKGSDASDGEAHLKTFISKYPQSEHAEEAKSLMRSKVAKAPTEPKVVGVLLPMKGKFAKFGARSLQAIELAFKIFSHAEPDSGIQLAIEDSGEDVETTLRALDALYSKHHVIAVIGPLLSKGIDQVTQRAQELGLPLISLAQQSGKTGDFVAQSALSPKLQSYSVLQYAIQQLGMHKFAVLYPKDKFGEQYSQAFWDAAEELGGEIVGFESYAPGETDFRQVIDKISGLYYTEARQKDLNALAEERKAQNITKRTRKTEQFYALKPIVDYDAVFIPDEPKVVGSILPTFAYRDIPKMRFLGIATWDSPELAQRAQNSAENAVFVDALFPDTANPVAKKFVTQFKTTFSDSPGSMEAMAYDAAGVLQQVLSVGAKTREDVWENVKAIHGYPGVTGRISYKDGQLMRNLPVLAIKDGQIIEAGAEPAKDGKDAKAGK